MKRSRIFMKSYSIEHPLQDNLLIVKG